MAIYLQAIFRKPRFLLKWVFLGTGVAYLLLLLVLFLVFYSVNSRGSNSASFLDQQFSLHSLPVHATALAFLSIVYYLLLNLVYTGLKDRPGPLFFLIAALLVLIQLEVFKLSDALLFRDFRASVYFGGSMAENVSDRLISLVLYTIPAVLVVFFVLQRDERERNRILIEVNRKLELEQLQTKHDLLRAQINPHFLHNTLNLIYTRTRQYDRKLADGILLLSDSMRYSMDATKQQVDLVPLQDEIKHLRNLISLQQLRFDEKLNIQFTTNGNHEGIQIPPLTLVTIAENAFKYGELYDPINPVTLELTIIETNEGRLLGFTVSNSKRHGPVEHSFGVGLANIRLRLKEVYKSAFNLQVREETGSYFVNLTIQYPK